MTDYVDFGAVVSPCGRWRRMLWREWAPVGPFDGGTALWICLNPSTADARTDDPSLRKMIGFTWRWGGTRAVVMNRRSWRSKSPAEVLARAKAGEDVVGPWNHDDMEDAITGSGTRARPDWIVLAWGRGAPPPTRAFGDPEALIRLWRGGDGHALALTADGSPQHPLMAAYSLAPGPMGPRTLAQLRGDTA